MRKIKKSFVENQISSLRFFSMSNIDFCNGKIADTCYGAMIPCLVQLYIRWDIIFFLQDKVK